MNRIQEPAREEFIQSLWALLAGRMAPLFLCDGRELLVLEPGTRNRDAGPDFLSALIIIDGKMQRGDVEIHPLADDWYRHRHHLDPRYNRVVLHVVTDPCPPDFATRRQDDEIIPTFNLDSSLDPGAELLDKGLETERGWLKDPTIDCALARQPAEQIAIRLDDAGRIWLQVKSDRWLERRSAVSWDQIFYEALFEALGYSKNSIPFLNLAQRLPWDRLRTILLEHQGDSYALCSALLFGTAGLLEKAGKEVQGFPPAAEVLWQRIAADRSLSGLETHNWTFFRLRPNNFPTRRLQSAVVLVMEFLEKGFLPLLLAQVADNGLSPQKQVRQLVNRIAVRRMESGGVGVERARDMVVNAVLPVLLAYARETDDPKLSARLLHLLAIFPLLALNENSRAMGRRLSLPNSYRLTTRQQQGALYLYRWICAETGICRRCLHSLHSAG
ncbi:DUF2851 family protein [candidate division KSB1 bacterium]|nr:DUF2851 family protein [candidate division KSB1 bacterium]